MNTNNISIVIVTWNNQDDIKECLNSLLNQTYKNLNIIIIDNASTDNTISIIENDFASASNIKLIKLDTNIYLSPANNLGIKYAIANFNSEYIMVLNSDTKVDEQLVSELAGILDNNSNVGAVGPKVKFWKNEKEGKINSAGLVYDGFLQAYDRGIFENDNGQFDKIEEVPAVSGTCILYRTKALLESGFYWEKLKMYCDELELSIRLRKKGWRIMYNPKATVWHHYMQSTNQNKLFKIQKQKNWAFLLIALRHYRLKSKLAMVRKYLAMGFGL